MHITEHSAGVEAGLTSSDLVQSCCWSRAMCFTEPPTTALMTRQPVSERLGRTRKVPCAETASIRLWGDRPALSPCVPVLLRTGCFG